MKTKKSMSRRERQVASLLLLGLKSKHVAKVMGLHEKTIGTYLVRWKTFICAPLVSNYMALRYVIQLIEFEPDYKGVLKDYEPIILKMAKATSPKTLNNLINQIQKL